MLYMTTHAATARTAALAILQAADETIGLMVASRTAAGMTEAEALESALAAFLRMCQEG